MADLATRFVNLKSRDVVRQFVMKHAGDLRSFPLSGSDGQAPTVEERLENNVSVLVSNIWNLRSAWTREKHGGLLDAEKTIQGILFSVRVAQIGRGIVAVDHSSSDHEDIWASPAVEPAPYRKSRKQVDFFFRFKRRDVLDEIAYAILVASKRGLLRMCKGHIDHPEWNCQTPFLVADEGRRKYCYGACGENNGIELSKQWHRMNPRRSRKDSRRGMQLSRSRRRPQQATLEASR